MPVIIQTNIASLEAQKNLANAQVQLAHSFNALSSGYRITSAADDAAGLAISDNMDMQVRSYAVAERNTNDAISMAQTAEGALGQISDVLSRLRELATQGANGSLSTTDRSYLATEFTSLQAEIKRMMTSTKFNGVQLINRATATISFQVGINNVTADRLNMTFGGMNLTALLTASTTVSGTAGNSQTALDTIDAALSRVETGRARFGAFMNRLDITVSNLQTMSMNVSAAESRIKDVDVAQETAQLSREQVLAQGGASVLAQANQVPQMALTLLKGG